MSKKDEYGVYTVTLDESQRIFDNINELKQFLKERYGFNEREIGIILVCSLNKLDKSLLIDIIYETYFNLGCMEEKNDMMIKLYDKVLKILNYHITHNNFGDKSSKFMKEFEYALLHYDQPDLGLESDGRTPKKK